MSWIHKSISTISEPFGTRLIWLGTAIVDAAFLVLWVVIQFLANRYIKKMDLEGPDRLVFAVFQWVLFPISTLTPIALWMYKDIRVMIIRVQRQIAVEKKKKKVK